MKDKKELLFSYIKTNVAPILVDFISSEDLGNVTILPASIDSKELNGHYEDVNFMPPSWFNELLNSNNKILVIDKIDSTNKEEQLKFVELLKYRKISTFELPSDCVIIITASEINNNTINEEIFSLVASI